MVWTYENSSWFIHPSHDNETRFILFCFYKSFPITLQRLVENCCYSPNCFHNVILVCLPFPDPLSGLDDPSIATIENAYLLTYSVYLNSFVTAEIPNVQCISQNPPISKPVEIEVEKINQQYYFVKKQSKYSTVFNMCNCRWYVSSILKGTQRRRTQLRRYIAFINSRLSDLGCTVLGAIYHW